MSEGILKLILGIFIFLVVAQLFMGSSEPNMAPSTQRVINTPQPSGDTTIQAAEAAEGLDLKALGELAKKAKTAEELEKLLNQPGSINNLDLDQDGQVDYLKVTEYGDDKVRGLSFTVDLDENQTQEIATIETEKVNEEEAEVQIQGNEQIYGANHYYHYRSPIWDFMLLSFLFNRDRDPWLSPYRYGSRPTWYNPYPSVPSSSYRGRVQPMTSTFSGTSASRPLVGSTVTSPNAGKAAESVRAPLRNPTTSQKSFQARTAEPSVRSGGFGRSTDMSATTNTQGVRSGGFGRTGDSSTTGNQAVRSGGFGRTSSPPPAPSRPSVRTGSSSRGGSFFGGGK
jgi:hypothetical protein